MGGCHERERATSVAYPSWDSSSLGGYGTKEGWLILGQDLVSCSPTSNRIELLTTKYRAPDAFAMKMEYAPSDKDLHIKEQRETLNLLKPHQKILRMLSSHFHACRLGNPHILRIFQRIVRASMIGLKGATGHPLARELRLQLVVFGLHVLGYSSNTMGLILQNKLKDQILSGALSWFYYSPL